MKDEHKGVVEAAQLVIDALEPIAPHMRRRAVDAAFAVLGHSGIPTPEADAVFAALRSTEPASATELSKLVGKSPTNVTNHLNRLQRAGLVSKRGREWVTAK